MTSPAEADRESPSRTPGPSERVWFWIGVMTVVIVLGWIGFWAVTLYWPPGNEQAAIAAYRISDDGEILEVQYNSGRDCDETLWARAEETEDAVVVDVAYRGFGRNEVHDDMARLCQATIELAAPLADRTVRTVEGVPVSAVWLSVSE